MSGPWHGRAVAVAGLGVTGSSVVRALAGLGAEVSVLHWGDPALVADRIAEAEALGARVLLPEGDEIPAGTRLLVTSPGLRPDRELFAEAARRGVPVWGDVELAWRLRGPDAAPWLAVTGTNGKTSTVRMLDLILRAAGHRSAAVGNVGTPVLDAVTAEQPPDVLAVELSSYQLHWAPSVRPSAAAVLNVAPDHLDWHGSLDAYAAAKGRAYTGTTAARVVNAQDPATIRLAAAAEATAPTVGFTLAEPAEGQLGLVGDALVDRAFGSKDVTLAHVADVHPPAPHNLANALAAAALARAHRVPAEAVREGLRAFTPDPHRVALVGTRDEVAYVDDSKATNPHAAAASLGSYPRVVWIAGGLAKGATFDDLVASAASRLAGAVLLGRDRELIRRALTRHAPDVPVVEVTSTDTGAMAEAVREATAMATAGDTVLLAPACASMDMFASYGRRGDAFAEAVTALGVH